VRRQALANALQARHAAGSIAGVPLPGRLKSMSAS